MEKDTHMKLFKDLNLNPQIQQALDKLGFTTPTEIQEKAIPVLLSEKNVDFHGQAQTGTGKTLAFGLPLIQKIDPSLNKTQALIVAPTRELVLQICESLKPILANTDIAISTIYGGVSIVKQLQDLRKGMHIIVGTPGRLNDHLRRKTLSLKDLKVLVLDEADIMLDMGFKDEIDEILAFAPSNRQIWLFSATIKPGIEQIKRSHMKDVVTIRTSQNNVGTQNTKQFYCIAPGHSRVEALCRIIDSDPEFYGFIFCPTKILTSEICEKLTANGYNVNTLHGDMDQPLRTRVIQQFKQKKFSILVATDVAARGLDVQDITHVVNYCLPNDHESYVHRIGRTGRAGKTGIAISFINSSELRNIKMLGSKFNVTINPLAVPAIDDIIKIQVAKIGEFVASKSERLPESEKYFADLSQMLAGFSDEQMKNSLINLLTEKFLKRFENRHQAKFNFGKELEQRESGSNYQRYGNKSELMIGLGSDDGITAGDIKNYLMDQGRLSIKQLGRVKVLRRKTFVVLPVKQIEELMPILENSRIQGKRARLSLVTEGF